ncbi:tyrosine-type recombinase/integrase [Thorsellia anophelis]|uniref:Phage integrase family protein n=1 Tax=Thorsellia anophelis DSM 18579 TaxID=1123402 RepID=A0A1I0D5E4_9GAMM|nr:tyrosine-type recombinase/integrase [Thorsellia anophelis]SET27418.1 Phage integrase family protein [Thorsellia anophelis DSM 18579]
MLKLIKKIFNREKTVNSFIPTYIQILESKNLKLKTLNDKKLHLSRFTSALGHRLLDDIKPIDVINLTQPLVEQGKHNSARKLYWNIKEFYSEAIIHGLCESSPLTHIKPPRDSVKRNRLATKDFLTMLQASKQLNRKKWFYLALLLAVITGQRRHDISKMKFSDIWDGYLHIKQQKTGAMVALPIDLRLDVIGMSINDVVSLCKIGNNSEFLLVHKNSSQVRPHSLSDGFRTLYVDCFGEWEKEGTQPSFHEIRSLSERLYREQGINTQVLLGHKRASMTDMYNDDRGLSSKDWKRLKL